MDESRKQFAEAFEELTGWELDEYPNQDYADTCWEFWKKSRAAIEIDLPEWFSPNDCGDRVMWSDAVENAIHAAGIKVKE